MERNHTLMMLACGASALLLGGCVNDDYGVPETVSLGGNAHLALTFVTPGDGVSTRSATGDPDGYEAGIDYEDYINIPGGDYKMYFFTYDEGDEKGGTLLAEFKPTEITRTSDGTATTYTVTGDVPNELLTVSDFRVVMLANWGWWYPSVTAGATTIDDLCEGENSTFYAGKKFVIDKDNFIPFYGVQEYEGVQFAINGTTELQTPLSLLRAVAKVEVILTDGNGIEAFDDVSIVNYNSQGYNAPAGVYTADDYDTEMSNNPSSGNWPDEWVKDLHLIGGANDTGTKAQAFTNVSDAGQDTWRIYLPEYDNTGNDFSHIAVTIDGVPFNIYFAEYDDDGKTDNSVVASRYNIKRNNLYRFYVSYLGGYFRVHVDKWEDTYENDFTFKEEDTYTDGDGEDGGDGPYGTDPDSEDDGN